MRGGAWAWPGDLGEALGQEFVRRTFSADTKAKTVDMTRRIETAMEQEIKTPSTG